MDVDRMIAMNCYTRADIYAYTRKKVERSIVCVGNILEQRQIEKYIKSETSFALIGGPGKTTTLLAVLDKLDLESDSIPIIRNPKKKRQGFAVYIFDDRPTFKIETITIKPPTKDQQDEYRRLTGHEMLFFSSVNKDSDKIKVAKMLKGRGKEIPSNTHSWLVRNFPNNADILKLCYLAQHVNDKSVYDALMKSVRYRRSINLKYPVHVK